jgi:hypothetical protein
MLLLAAICGTMNKEIISIKLGKVFRGGTQDGSL